MCISKVSYHLGGDFFMMEWVLDFSAKTKKKNSLKDLTESYDLYLL